MPFLFEAKVCAIPALNRAKIWKVFSYFPPQRVQINVLCTDQLLLFPGWRENRPLWLNTLGRECRKASHLQAFGPLPANHALTACWLPLQYSDFCTALKPLDSSREHWAVTAQCLWSVSSRTPCGYQHWCSSLWYKMLQRLHITLHISCLL
jgi:hypothetical protein